MGTLKKYILNSKPIIFVSLLTQVLLTGCEPTLSCSTTSTSMKCSYKELNENKMTQNEGYGYKVKKGQTLHLEYNTVVNSGELTIDAILKDYKVNIHSSAFSAHYSNNKSIWNKKLESSMSGSVEIPIESDGVIVFNIKGNKTNGSYEIKWGINGLL